MTVHPWQGMNEQGMGNLFAGRPPAQGEDFKQLLRCRNLVIERILSSPRPDDVEYYQEQDEWVALLQGRASLELAGRILDLEPGDTLFIPAHTRHRVIATSAEPHCVWLAVHLYPDSETHDDLADRLPV
jgi:cupin 2 domain-containing protein